MICQCVSLRLLKGEIFKILTLVLHLKIELSEQGLCISDYREFLCGAGEGSTKYKMDTFGLPKVDERPPRGMQWDLRHCVSKIREKGKVFRTTFWTEGCFPPQGKSRVCSCVPTSGWKNVCFQCSSLHWWPGYLAAHVSAPNRNVPLYNLQSSKQQLRAHPCTLSNV